MTDIWAREKAREIVRQAITADGEDPGPLIDLIVEGLISARLAGWHAGRDVFERMIAHRERTIRTMKGGQWRSGYDQALFHLSGDLRAMPDPEEPRHD